FRHCRTRPPAGRTGPCCRRTLHVRGSLLRAARPQLAEPRWRVRVRSRAASWPSLVGRELSAVHVTRLERSRMTKRGMQIALCLVLAGCGTSSSTTAQPASGSGESFAISPIATFDNPWALAFLPGARTAIVTEKPGHIWLVDAGTGQKQPVAGAPRVLYEGQGGLLDVVLSPSFATDNQVYLTYSEPSPKGGS